MNEYLLSVVIPTFNRAALLPDALDSVFAQDIADLQVIVVDDGSTDETRRLVNERYGARVDYLSQENRGASAARNVGLSRTRGEFVSFLDSDDVWLGGKAATELSLFARQPEADAIISDSEYWTEHRLIYPSRFAERGVRFDEGDAPQMLTFDTLCWLRGSVFSTCCLTLRRSALARVGGFDASLALYEDWDFEIRLFHACRVLTLPRVTAQVRRFHDLTRRGRPLPGTPPDARQARSMLAHQHRVLEQTLAHLSLTAHIVARVRERMREIDAEIARLPVDASATGAALTV